MTAPTLPPRAEDEPAPVRRPRLRGVLAPVRARLVAARAAGRQAAAPSWALGVVAALWAALVGLAVALVPMVLVWMTSPASGLTWTDAVRLGGLLWVLCHGVPLTIAGVTITLVPWGLALVPLLLLGYAGGWAARRSAVADARSALVLVAAGSVTYATLVAAVSSLSAEPTSRTSPVTAAVHGLVLAVLALGWGALRAAGVAPGWPRPVTVAVRAGLVAAATLIGLGSLAAAASLLTHLDDAVTMAQALGGGLGGGLGLVVLGIGYVPVLAVWGTAYVLGAGVLIGPGVTLSPFLPVTAPTDLPPFPLLAALPQGTATVAWLLPVTGILAGVLAGLLIARRARPEPRLVRLAMAGGSALLAGVALGAAARLAAGALGDDRLSSLGPLPVTVGVLGAVLVALGAVPSAVVPSAAAPSSAGRRRLTVAAPNHTPPESADAPRTADPQVAAPEEDRHE